MAAADTRVVDTHAAPNELGTLRLRAHLLHDPLPPFYWCWITWKTSDRMYWQKF